MFYLNMQRLSVENSVPYMRNIHLLQLLDSGPSPM